MSALVKSVVDASDDDTSRITKPQRDDIQRIGNKTEYELETYWSRRVINARNAKKALSKFPYTHNYAELVKREVSLLRSTGFELLPNQRALIIGSGPLPLTYIELQKQTGAVIDVLDSSSEAITMSSAFCNALNIATRHIHGAGETVVLSKTYDVILLAALAGGTDIEKQSIIRNVLPNLSVGGRLIARSAKGSRTLLYPSIDTPFTGLELIAEEHPTDEVINSILIYKKKRAQ